MTLSRSRPRRYGDGNQRARSWLTRIGAVAVIGALALGAGDPALARAPRRPAVGDVSVFASAPAPGHPFGIAVDEDVASTSRRAPATSSRVTRTPTTSASSPTTRTAGWSTRRSSTRPTNSDMGLFGLALDGNQGTNHKLYVADMNGRILRLDAGQPTRPRRSSSRRCPPRPASPATGCCRCGTTSCSTRPATCTSPTTSRGSGGSLRTGRRRSGSPTRG